MPLGSGIQDAFSFKTIAQSSQGSTRQVDFSQTNTQNTILESQCPATPNCFNSKYRKIDGSCNNNRDTKLGEAMTPLQRILQPAYSDGRLRMNLKFILNSYILDN